MLLLQIKERVCKSKFELQKEDIKLSYYSNYSYGLHAEYLSYIKNIFIKITAFSFPWCYVRYIDYISR